MMSPKNKFFTRDPSKFGERDDLKERFNLKFQTKTIETIIQKHGKELFFDRLPKIIDSMELIQSNSELEIEFERSSLRLDKMREIENCIDIPEGVWDFSKNLLQKISKKFLIKSQKEMPIPKIDFIEESIEIRWIKDKFKLILSITDYFNNIVIYVRTRNGQYLSEPVSRDDVINWVLFWLNQL